MLADELSPVALAAARRRWQAMAAEHVAQSQVGVVVTELEQFALDPAVSPGPVLVAESEYEFVEFAPGERSLSARSSGVGGPFAADQLAMPPEQRRRPGQERSPGRPGHSSADGGEEEAVAGTPAESVDLTFEPSKLLAEGENLSAEPGVWPVDEEDLQQEADHGVGT